MTESPGFLSERLRFEREKTISFFKEIDSSHWNKKIYTDGEKWNVHEILAHFVSTEKALYKLINNIVTGGDGAPLDFEIDKFNEAEVKQIEGLPATSLLSQFDNDRLRMIKLVQNLTEADLQKSGRHPFLGVVPIAEIIKLVYRHNQIHQREIRKSLATS